MIDHREPKPQEIEDLHANMMEESLHWKRPHLKPLEEMIDKSNEINKLKVGDVPALDIDGLITNY